MPRPSLLFAPISATPHSNKWDGVLQSSSGDTTFRSRPTTFATRGPYAPSTSDSRYRGRQDDGTLRGDSHPHLSPLDHQARSAAGRGCGARPAAKPDDIAPYARWPTATVGSTTASRPMSAAECGRRRNDCEGSDLACARASAWSPRGADGARSSAAAQWRSGSALDRSRVCRSPGSMSHHERSRTSPRNASSAAALASGGARGRAAAAGQPSFDAIQLSVALHEVPRAEREQVLTSRPVGNC